MSLKITVLPDEITFPAEQGESVLAAALRHGYGMIFDCRSGICGACKGKILRGSVEYGDYRESALSEKEKSEGYALFCCAKPHTDLEIESPRLRK